MKKLASTDWDSYYENPFFLARFSRKITVRTVKYLIGRYLMIPGSETRKTHEARQGQNAEPGLKIAEFGGAGSCFLKTIARSFPLRNYVVIDSNPRGLAALEAALPPDCQTIAELRHENLFQTDCASIQADLVFSAGLIEHFPETETKELIERHFDAVREDGIVILLFPTPTWLYRLSRSVAELLHCWIFHDERPLRMEEVLEICKDFGIPLHKRIIWSIFLTQGVLVIRKNRQNHATNT